MILATLSLTALTPKVKTIFFVTSDCPIAQRYVPEIKRIIKDYKSVSTFRLVYEDSGVSQQKVSAHHSEYNMKCPFSLDKGHSIAKRYKITVVPTALVLNDRGETLYRGRIDDSYGENFKWRPAKQLDLRNALSALRDGKSVPVKVTSVIGCTLSF